MNQPSLTIDQQISRLKTRGMIIEEDYARDILGKISYSRLKRYWWDMINRTTNTFYPNSKFTEAVERYDFDRSLRIILFNAIEAIEIALRTKMINILSVKYGGLWYLDTSLFTDPVRHAEHVMTLKREFARSKDAEVQQYISHHTWYKSKLTGDNPDSWFIFEYATLGTLSKFYENIKPADAKRAEISNEFGLPISSDFSSWLKSITELRNAIAHHSRLWKRKLALAPATPSSLSSPWLDGGRYVTSYYRPFYVISAILYLLREIQPENDLKKRILCLIQRHPKINIRSYGFIADWDKEPIWRISYAQRLRIRLLTLARRII